LNLLHEVSGHVGKSMRVQRQTAWFCDERISMSLPRPWRAFSARHQHRCWRWSATGFWFVGIETAGGWATRKGLLPAVAFWQGCVHRWYARTLADW